MTDGFGSITWWGFSPCLDLLDKDVNKAVAKMSFSLADDEPVNVLLVGAGDCRHILKTLSQCYKRSKRKINFYLAESSMELYARHLLLLTVALESQKRMGIQEKTELFLELYGNILVRKQSSDYVEKMSADLIKMVTDFDYLETKMPIIDMSLLKFKERDMLEGIFKFWRNTDTSSFEAGKYWDLRLRKYLGVRYDAIPNIFDWDFHMKLSEKGAGIINSSYYAKWRQKGIAFEIREGSYDMPNKTLASGMVFNVEGEKHARRGYWGDIIVSPYISFGIESENQELFKKSNKVYTKCSEHVSEYNLNAMFYELANKEKYVEPSEPEIPSTPVKGPTLTEIQEEDEDETRTKTDKDDLSTPVNPLDQPYEAIDLAGVKVFFLPLHSVAELHKKSRFYKLFNLVYFSNSMVHQLSKEVTDTFADKTSLILETAKFMLELKKDQSKEFVKKIISIGSAVGCKVLEPVNEDDDNFIKFTFQRFNS